jgi:cytochrome bd-type quinol oxidase subunit 2
MKNSFIKIFVFAWSIIIPLASRAQGLLSGDAASKMYETTSELGSGAFNNTNIAYIMSKVVEGFLALLGIIFLILILLAGYKWMTAQGEESKVEEAKHTIQRAIIGLLIILAAYAITYFVFTRLDFGEGGGGGGMGSP